jgi:hypothetical protein
MCARDLVGYEMLDTISTMLFIYGLKAKHLFSHPQPHTKLLYAYSVVLACPFRLFFNLRVLSE